ncbi:hypothetical protein HDU96_009373 [Phlyctochytrium bullatum]|nr:hypothetical protein HDU96_009373 [Phlyctochytrium bullatum]
MASLGRQDSEMSVDMVATAAATTTVAGNGSYSKQDEDKTYALGSVAVIGNSPTAKDPSSPFAFTADELAALITPQKDVDHLYRLGGVTGILNGLHVNPEQGLVSTKEDERREAAEEFEKSAADNAKGLPTKRRLGKTTSTTRLGISAESVDDDPSAISKHVRQQVFGANVLPSVKPKNIFQYMLQAMEDKILILLTTVAFISLAIGIYRDLKPPKDAPEEEKSKVHWIEGFAIIVAVIIVVLASSINDFQKEKQFRKLNAKKEDRKVKLIRDGRTQLVSVYSILVGDVLLLEPGDVIAADGVYISGMGLKCDESAATGETDAVKKGDGHDPFIVSGGKVTEGIGKYVVTAVGVHSFYGKTMMALRTEAEDTPLQVKLDGLAERIAKLGAAIAILMFVVLILKYVITVLRGSGFGETVPEQESGAEVVARVVNILIQSITIVVVAVPEGLPLAVTLALAYATTRMLKDNNLVRVLSACETMGNATTICSDKTGTLTQNRMTVVTGVIGKNVMFEGADEVTALSNRLKDLSREGGAESDVPLPSRSKVKHPGHDAPVLFDRIMENLAINSSAFEGVDEITKKPTLIGSKTETALLEWAICSGYDFKALRSSPTIETVQVYPFSSERKRMATIVKVPGKDGKPIYRVHVKGASEIVLRDCDRVALLPFSASPTAVQNEKAPDRNSKATRSLGAVPNPGSRSNPTAPVVYPLDTKLMNDYNEIIGRFADQSLRTIAIAYREFSEEEFLALLRGKIRDKFMELRKAERDEQKRASASAATEGLLIDHPVPRSPITPIPSTPLIATADQKPSFLSVADAGIETRSFETRSEEGEEPTDSELLAHNIALDELAGKGLLCAAVVGIEDPLRPGVAEAVADCQRAGVFVRMVTGDNILTARSIASKCGIFTKGGLVMEGSYFRKLTDAERMALLPRLQVLARSSPTDKQLLVSNLKAMGETVAVTGDGTNDGPALKLADIGFSMGIAGTEVAKEASSIILMDDSFSSVVNAIVWGRGVNDSVKKFLQFQLAVNVSAVLITFISAVLDSGESSVLTAVQLLWVNLIMDTLAALALATEAPTRENLNRPPESKKNPLITITMWKMILGQAFLQITVNLALLFAGPQLFRFDALAAAGGILRAEGNAGEIGDQKAKLRTIVFNSFVMMQMFNQINCRRIDNTINVFNGILRNPFLYCIFIGVVFCQVIIVNFGSVGFSTVPISGVHWAVSILVGFLSIPMGVILRLIPDDIIFGKKHTHNYRAVGLRSGPGSANQSSSSMEMASIGDIDHPNERHSPPAVTKRGSHPTPARAPPAITTSSSVPVAPTAPQLAVPSVSVTLPITDPEGARTNWANAIHNVQSKMEVFTALRGGGRRGESGPRERHSISSISSFPATRNSNTAINVQSPPMRTRQDGLKQRGRAQTMDSVSAGAVTESSLAGEPVVPTPAARTVSEHELKP